MIQLAEFDLSTHYLGLPVKSPLIIGASPLADQPERVRQLERAGAGAITLHSLFEEQIRLDEQATEFFTEAYDDTFGEALTYFPRLEDFNIGPEQYLTKIRNLKEVTDLPIIGSLNGVSFGGWVQYATAIEEAGADALELNFYHIATNPEESGSEVEGRLLEVLMRIRECVHIPIAVKLSPFYSALPHLAVKLTSAGANGLVLFNRFYQPDIDIEMQETLAHLQLSDSSELPMRLRWIAALYGKVEAELISSGGVHEPEDLIKVLMTGATGVQIVSCLLKKGPAHLAYLRNGLTQWMREHDYKSIRELRGSMSMLNCPDPEAFERANYMRILQGWRM